MTTTPTERPTADLPSILDLDRSGRSFMLAWLSMQMLIRQSISSDDWREAYGKAADHQTVTNARIVLAGGVS